MHFNLYVPLQIALLATAVLARPSNHGLMKRHFWCNGVDSESICPEGQTMVPIDDYACSAIASAGRLNQISPPVNGETSTTCPQQQQQQQQQASAEKLSPPPAAKKGSLESTPVLGGSLESTPVLNSAGTMHLTCTEVGGAPGSSFLLNCTTVA